MSMALVWHRDPALDAWIEEALARYAEGATIEEAVAKVAVDVAALDEDELTECIRARLRDMVAHQVARIRTKTNLSEDDLKERADERLSQLLRAVDVLQRVRFDGVALEDMTLEQLARHRDRTTNVATTYSAQSGWFADAVRTLEHDDKRTIRGLTRRDRDRLRSAAEGVW